MRTSLIHTGSAGTDVQRYRGWLVGHFVDRQDGELRRSNDVEIAWRVHPAGDARPEWVRGETRTTIVILVSGKFRIRYASEDDGQEDQVLLSEQGDYVMWGPGVDHRWFAEEDSVFVCVRWPSRTNA